MAVKITSTGSYVPEKILTNYDLAGIVDTSDEWIRSHTGIGERRIAGADEAASDLACEAAWNALRAADPERPEQLAAALDLIIVATASPDYPGFPSVACIVQNRIGARNAAAFDITAGCSGFVYALDIAACMLAGRGRKKALVIGAEVLSRITDWTDRDTCILFGDGAGAVFIESVSESGSDSVNEGIITSLLGADGSGSEKLIIRRGGSRYPFAAGENIAKPPYIEMDGHAVYLFAVNAVTRTVQRLLDESGFSIGDIKRIIPHQANERIIEAAAKRLGIGTDLFFLNMSKYANTSAASVPIALDELNRTGFLKKGDIIITLGFGAGLTYGGNLIVW
jgi:3-oxoacyl-[acyl-carrier-protein] synthase III